jgi:quercetin dioxygenase-like cupin family protein
MNDSTAPWGRELDAVIAAPGHHRLAMENEAVRVLETRIESGETVPLHTHEWPAALYILSWSDFVRRDETGAVLVDSRLASQKVEPGQPVWSAPLGPHTLENVGADAIHLISVEVKSVSRHSAS